MDYKKLLSKYMDLVTACEGSDYLHLADFSEDGMVDGVETAFTAEEMAELQSISTNLYAEAVTRFQDEGI